MDAQRTVQDGWMGRRDHPSSKRPLVIAKPSTPYRKSQPSHLLFPRKLHPDPICLETHTFMGLKLKELGRKNLLAPKN